MPAFLRQGKNTRLSGDERLYLTDDYPKLIEVADRFVVRQEIDNIAWIDLGGVGVIVDAMEHAELADEIIGEITSTLEDVGVGWVINTHTHYDHVALNDAFRKRWGSVILSRQTADFGPDRQMSLEGNVRSAVFKPLDSGHSPDDCIVWFPEERVLFTGDIFGWGMIPLVCRLDHRNADILLAAYRHILSYEADVIVPGHEIGRAHV